MRITNQTMLHNYLTNLNRNLTNMSIYQNQLSSGKEVSKPSDDPFAVTRAMSLHTSINQNAQYLKNIEDSIGWVDMSDAAMGSIGDAMNRLRELVLEGANGTNDDSARGAVIDEVEQIVSQIAQLGNTNYDGRYIFGGQKTTEPPFEVITNKNEKGVITECKLVYHGAKSSNKVMLPREVSQNVKMDINVPGTWIQSGKNGEFSDFDSSLAGTLNGIIVTLNELNELDELTQKQKNGEFSTDDLTRLTELQGKNLNQSLGGELLGQVDDHIDNMLSIRSELGAKANRLDAAKKKNDEETFNMTKLLSKTEDIDFAEKIMQYMMMSNVYEASLSTGAKILQPTILDFLK